MFQLVSEAAVPQHHADWSSFGPEESCCMELLSAFPPLLSACSQPAYTNYVGGFHGCLDYIFIQPDSMQVLIPFPAAAAVFSKKAPKKPTGHYIFSTEQQIDKLTDELVNVLEYLNM